MIRVDSVVMALYNVFMTAMCLFWVRLHVDRCACVCVVFHLIGFKYIVMAFCCF